MKEAKECRAGQEKIKVRERLVLGTDFCMNLWLLNECMSLKMMKAMIDWNSHLANNNNASVVIYGQQVNEGQTFKLTSVSYYSSKHLGNKSMTSSDIYWLIANDKSTWLIGYKY